LKEEAVDRTELALQRGCGPVVRQTAELRLPHSPAYLHGELRYDFTLSGHRRHQIHTQSLYLQLTHLNIHGTGWSLREVESLPMSGDEPQ